MGGVAIDAGGMGNEGRFCNDYRGVPVHCDGDGGGGCEGGGGDWGGDGGGGGGEGGGGGDGNVGSGKGGGGDGGDEGGGRGERKGRGKRKGGGRGNGKWGEGEGGGTRKRPNAEFKMVWDSRIKERGMAIFVMPAGKKATRREREVGIRKGEEVLVSYGRGFWNGRRKGDDAEGGEGEGGQEEGGGG
ncbi:hypothetical protein QBC47DRAFT_372886 [Echria macrotheca]|uniref:SET domain-containing protein n=1 Tax=Echria macrotheca TaxID=438768 RepID=A0AAJ0F918_9PEZI|nr:hypothetical protein QBC47DRAFT_372886 [Echria macrotheca]